MAFRHIKLHVRSLQRNLLKHTNGGRKYKQACISKQLSKKNRKLRIEFGEKYQDETVESFWQYINFTDEMHIDPSEQRIGHILREEGTRYATENLQERPPKQGSCIHVAGWANWHSKCEKLRFYNNEEEYIEKPSQRGKPRKSKYESPEDFNKRLMEWEAEAPYNRVVKPKGNSMTQKYYVDHILPIYVDIIHQQRLRSGAEPDRWILQEDGDPSHGHRTEGLAQRLKSVNWIVTLDHPPQSPDLNPIEALWAILKRRLRKRMWHTLDEFKELVQ